MHNVFAFANTTMLQEQLKLVMGNFRSTLIIIPICLILWWSFSNPLNNHYLMWWTAAAILSNLLLQWYSWQALKKHFSLAHVKRTTRIYMLMHVIDGVLWGLLSWLVLDTISNAQAVIVMAIYAGMLGAALATLSAIPAVFVAFTLPHAIGFTSKLWLMDDINYQSLAVFSALYFISLLGQLLNSAKSIQTAIAMKFELAINNLKLREIEKSQTLEQERQRLMQEMHDGLGSSLVSALRVVEKGKMQSSEVAQVLKDCIDDLKLAIDSIEPVDHDLLLLLATLRFRLGSRLENTGMRLHWKVNYIPPLTWLDPRSSLHVLRILQEAFTNIIKHTRATEVTLTTSQEAEFVVVRISDNGPGFELNTAMQSGGRGLTSQLHRAQAIGAEISWFSTASETTVSLRLPISPDTF